MRFLGNRSCIVDTVDPGQYAKSDYREKPTMLAEQRFPKRWMVEVCEIFFENGNAGSVTRPVEGFVFHSPCYFAPPLSVIRMGDYKLLDHLLTGEQKLFNVVSDYKERQNDLTYEEPQKALELKTIMSDYLDSINAEDIQDVYKARFAELNKFEALVKEVHEKAIERADGDEAAIAEANERLEKNREETGANRVGTKFQMKGKSNRNRKRHIVIGLIVLSYFPFHGGEASEKPPFTDYCERLAQEIQGRKHGFLAGNVTYYVGGFHASWNLIEDETIGLTHPFHHDLRSRGIGVLDSEISGTENTGKGNDYNGWEFYKDTKVLYGSVIVDGTTYTHPKPTSMRWRPDKVICEYEVAGVKIREEKFIAANDAAASLITSSKPVTLEFSGHSFYHRNSVSSTASIRFDADQNALVVSEGGTVKSRPDPDAAARVGLCVYDGMTTVLSASRAISKSVTTKRDDRAVQLYSFQIPCDEEGTTVSWAMADKPEVALKSARDIIQNSKSWLAAKTAEMNRQLNDEIPYFRCPDEKFVDIYYYLWSLYLMYYIEVGEGWEMEHHTQTAVNNFLGIHRYDAAFQIKVGAWTTDKERYAYGNVLTWKHLTKNDHYRELDSGLRLISDNKGTSWHSGAYGGETSEHVLGAWQIYEHTGDVEFLKDCYEDHFAKLFRNRISEFFMNEFEVAEVLEKMARLTGNRADVEHWQKIARRDPEHIRLMFDQRWQMNGVSNFFLAQKNGLMMTTGFWAMRSPHFPNEYAKPMVDAWALNRDEGFYGEFFPLAMSKQSMKTFATDVDHSFGYTPDTAYFTLDGMFRQRLVKDATVLTLNHLANYNFHDEWQIPVAPEAYERDLKLFGDQYSNFNAGKILLYLEGLAGLQLSVPDKKLTIRPALPKAWNWMEFRLPINNQWTKVRYTKDDVEVSGSPFTVERLSD